MDTCIYLVRAVILITIGVLAANIVLESNFMRLLMPVIEPFCHASNLSHESILAIFASFFNPTAGKSTLAGFYHAGKVSGDEATVTVVMCTFPIVAGESLFRVQAPIAIVLLGPFIGGIYIGLNLLSAFIQSFSAFIYSRLRYSRSQHGVHDRISIPANSLTVHEWLTSALKKSFHALKKIIPITVVSFIAVDTLFKLGLMTHISLLFEPVLRVLDLPGECITVLLADLAHFSAGYATVAALLSNGAITPKQAIITLLIGSLIIIILIYLKYSISMYISLFGKLGLKISIVNLSCSFVSKLMTILLVMLLM